MNDGEKKWREANRLVKSPRGRMMLNAIPSPVMREEDRCRINGEYLTSYLCSATLSDGTPSDMLIPEKSDMRRALRALGLPLTTASELRRFIEFGTIHPLRPAYARFVAGTNVPAPAEHRQQSGDALEEETRG